MEYWRREDPYNAVPRSSLTKEVFQILSLHPTKRVLRMTITGAKLTSSILRQGNVVRGPMYWLARSNCSFLFKPLVDLCEDSFDLSHEPVMHEGALPLSALECFCDCGSRACLCGACPSEFLRLFDRRLGADSSTGAVPVAGVAVSTACVAAAGSYGCLLFLGHDWVRYRHGCA